ncbi:7-deoxyloganetin glucosyltransferase-like [Pyrus ussuriensis x Pyrus communis]|uniref:7-deoxyloganetin glucosyltransferase-like n=1 Tax=Pyrus ussuriensis x Pyrus communis TaxID=2448454 RepID=A0A5N5GD62_9ROSA|nr:7-deoxyloganetin glucosyltransferase-like [Pyrus ussuriensis x Pyrus communis]
MDATAVVTKPHAVCIPIPTQSHIKAMLKFAKLLHSSGFHITFVNTEFNHKRFLKSLGPDSLDGLPDFRFEAVPDGLPDSNEDTTQDLILLADSIRKQYFLAPFRGLLNKLNNDAISTSNNPPVTSIVSDGFMSPFTFTAAQEIGVPSVLLYTFAACLTNGYLERVVDWIPGMKDIRLKDLPTLFRTTNPDDIAFNFKMEGTDRAHEASAIVIHTFDALETDVLWKEETECLEWLNAKAPDSVMYVNFGSVAVMKPEDLVEFGWGLANSKLPFFWVIRPDLVVGESAILQPEFVAEIKERILNHPSVGGFLTHSGWNSTIESLTAGVPMLCWPYFCDQQMNCHYTCNEWGIGMEISNDVKRDEVEKLGEKGKKLKNKVMESKKLAKEATGPNGVPMLCWPFFADQPTNCHCTCKRWGIGIEINNVVKRDDVEKLVRELMEGEKGARMKNKAMEWKELAEEATGSQGSSSANFEKLVNQIQFKKI